ncbi:Putative hydrolase [Minicystis rosea]|nr:Putative hydrolase [Minicystis rosea]
MVTSAGRVHVLEGRGRGALPPVVLLHGISSAGVHFLPLLHRLRGRVRHLVAPDMPAHGFSDPPPVMRPEAMKEALVEAMDAVVHEPSIVFGNSMGGIAAVHYALARPERVRGLILCSPSGASMDEDELRRFVRGFDLGTHGAALDFVDRLFARPNPMRHLFAWGVRRQFSDPRVRGLLSAIAPQDLLRPEQLSALRMPVMLLWGRDERILPREHYEFFRRHLPAHTFVSEPEGLGHAPYLDDVGAVARQILTFAADLHYGRVACAA